MYKYLSITTKNVMIKSKYIAEHTYAMFLKNGLISKYTMFIKLNIIVDANPNANATPPFKFSIRVTGTGPNK